MVIKTELFIAEELSTKDGYTWTMSSRLGDTLRKAQELFGGRDMDYTILGVEFVLTDRPRIWYPGNCKNIIIQLDKHALEDIGQALYQLSHETVHCLSPKRKKIANVLEEGLATYFSVWYMQQSGFESWFPTLQEYKDAISLVKQLLAVDMELIKKVRQITPTISDIKPNDFFQINPNLDKDLLDKLCNPFY